LTVGKIPHFSFITMIRVGQLCFKKVVHHSIASTF